MTERSIVAKLRAEITDYQSKMKQAQQSTKAVGDEAGKTSQKSKLSFDSMAKSINNHQASLNGLSTGLGVAGAAIGAFGVAAVKTAANFDKSMSEVKATGSDAAKNIGALRQEAIKLGADTQFSATQAAGGIEALLKAGVSAQDVMGGGLAGAMNLAAAGQLDVADAAETAATAMTQFNLAGKDVPHIADLLAAGAGKAQGEVSDMAQALNQSGLVASQFGLSVEDTVGTLTAFAKAGLVGSDAGTSFKTMLTQLANPSAKAAATMKDLGINAYDAQGKFVGITKLAGQLHDKLNGLSESTRNQALAQIFGNDAIRAAGVLYNDGADGIAKWIKQTNDAGYAAKVAATKMDNLQGDLEQLHGSIETAFIGAGEGQQSPIRDMVQDLTSLINKWNDLSAGTKTAVSRVSLALAGLALGGAGILKIVTFAASVKTSLSDLGVGAQGSADKVETGTSRMSKGLRGVATAAGVAAGAIAVINAIAVAAKQFEDPVTADSIEKLNTALLQMGQNSKGAKNALDVAFTRTDSKGNIEELVGGVDDLSSAFRRVYNEAAAEKISDVFEGIIGAVSPLESQLDQVKDQFGQVDQALTSLAQDGETSQAAAAFAKIASAAKQQGVSVKELVSLFPNYKNALANQAAQLKVTNLTNQDYADWMAGKIPAAIQKATAAQDDQKSAVDQARAAMEQQGESADGLSDAQTILGGKTAELKSAQDDLAKATQSVIDKFTILKDGALSQSRATDQWETSLNDLAKQVSDTASAQDSLRSANERVADAERNLKKVRGNSKSTSDEIRQAERQLSDARRDAAKAQDNLTDAQNKNSKSLKGNSDVAIANRGKIRDAISAMNDKVTADFKANVQTEGLTKATKDASKETQDLSADLVNNAKKAGYNKDQVKKMVDQMVLTPKELRTQVNTPGMDTAKKKVDDLTKAINDMKSKNVKLQFDASFKSGFKLPYTQGSTGKVVAHGFGTGSSAGGKYATGGHVTGPGTGTSDSIHAMLSNGEFVIKEASVRKLGTDRLNFMNRTGDLPRYRDGGLVNSGGLNTGGLNTGDAATPSIIIHTSVPKMDGVTEALTTAAAAVLQNATEYAQGTIIQGLMAQSGGLVGSGSFAKALSWAESQEGKPYIWAAAGPNGYDCSGFMGAIQNVIEGKSPYSRRWSTQAFQGQDQAQGFTKNAQSAFMIGVTNAGVGHTAGTLNGVNVESRGGAGVIVGPKARGWDDPLFPMHYGLTAGIAGNKGILGAALNEKVSGSPQQIFKKQMLIAGYPASDWPKVDYIISNESGWNVHATNPSSGAYGLPQALPGNKMAKYGADWRNSAAVQGDFFYDYINRYGGLQGAYDFWRSHHWYADGGFVSGAGGSRDDKIPAMLSNGEFVINADATRAFRPLLESMNNGVLGFAGGGPVKAAEFGRSQSFSVAAIVSLMRAVDAPTRELAKFTAQVKKATAASKEANRDVAGPKRALERATKAYDSARASQSDLRLENAKQLKDAKDAVAKASNKLDAAKIKLDKIEPEGKKAAAAQRALSSAIASRNSKARSNAEQIAKYNDKIAKAKKGTLAYQNLINSKELAQKANRREIAAADEKIAKARKAAAKSGVDTAKVAAAQERVAKRQAQLDKARDKQSQVSRTNTLQAAEASNKVAKALAAKKKAQDAYNKVADAAKAKTQALKDATEQLAQQEKAVADAANQVSSTFTDAYLSKSSAVADWLQSMNIGTKDITDLTSRLGRLRKLGLSETLIQQILGMAENQGAPAGEAIANAIISGGTKTVDKLNKAAQGLQDAADILGYKTATASIRGGHAAGTTGSPTGWYRTAEQGAEIVLSPQTRWYAGGEQVLNARQTAALLSGGGSGMSQQQLIAAVAAIVDSRPIFEGNQFGYNPAGVMQAADRQRAAKLHSSGVGVFG